MAADRARRQPHRTGCGRRRVSSSEQASSHLGRPVETTASRPCRPGESNRRASPSQACSVERGVGAFPCHLGAGDPEPEPLGAVNEPRHVFIEQDEAAGFGQQGLEQAVAQEEAAVVEGNHGLAAGAAFSPSPPTNSRPRNPMTSRMMIIAKPPCWEWKTLVPTLTRNDPSHTVAVPETA